MRYCGWLVDNNEPVDGVIKGWFGFYSVETESDLFE